MMMLLYTVGNWWTGLVNWWLQLRVSHLETRYATAARAAEKLAHDLNRRPGNSNTPDPYVAAKGYYELGKLVEDRDRLETRYTTWQGRADRFQKARRRIQNWQGRYVPYLIGAVDVVLIAAVLHFTGAVSLTDLPLTNEVAASN